VPLKSLWENDEWDDYAGEGQDDALVVVFVHGYVSSYLVEASARIISTRVEASIVWFS
jgi:hypothetical protein